MHAITTRLPMPFVHIEEPSCSAQVPLLYADAQASSVSPPLPPPTFASAGAPDKPAASPPVYLGWQLLRQIHLLMRHMDVKPAMLLVLLSVAEAAVVAKVGQVSGGFYLILVNKQLHQFWSVVLQSSLLYSVSALVAASTDGLANYLAVRWRGSLTQHLQRSYCAASNAFYRLPPGIDNPDQRLTQDTALVCSLISDITKVLLAVPWKILYYAFWTYHYTSFATLLAVMLFFLLGGLIQRCVMRPLSHLVFEWDWKEGNFRAAHARVRTLKEEIALTKGGPAEQEALDVVLHEVLTTQQRLVWQRWVVGLATKGIEYAGMIVNYGAIAVPVFSGGWDHMDSGELAQAISVSSFMTLSLVYSLTQVLDLADKWSTVSGAAARVAQILEEMDFLNGANQKDPREEDSQQLLSVVPDSRPPSVASDDSHKNREMGRSNLSQLVVAPTAATVLEDGIELEYSVHALGAGLAADVGQIFVDAPPGSPLLAVMTFQGAQGVMDVTEMAGECMNQQVIKEMDRMLSCFLRWQGVVRHMLTHHGYWCDAVDPRTGRALHGVGGDVWSEVTAANVLLGYNTKNTGLCPIVIHPTFGCSSYPATLFTSAPLDVLQTVLRSCHSPALPCGLGGPQNPLEILHLAGVTCHTPLGLLVVRDLDISMAEGGSCLVMGPSGCGKSTLVKALAGLWPMNATQVHLPPLAKVSIVPQQPFVAPGSTLRQQMSYRQMCDIDDPHSPPHCAPPSDHQIHQLLDATGLPHLADRVDRDFDRPSDWQGSLSPGEMQRLACASVLLQRPQLAILDEATSAVNEEMEVRMYKMMAAAGIAVLTFGQREGLINLHGTMVKLAADGSGAWKLLRSYDQAVADDGE